MKIEMNVFEKRNSQKKNGRIMKVVLASFLTLLAVSTVACTKEDAKKEEQSIKEVATVPKKEEKKEEEKALIEENPSILSITYLNVGQGNSVFIECDDHYMLIDGGTSDQSSKIYSFLEKKDIEKLDFVVATNTNEENVGGLAVA